VQLLRDAHTSIFGEALGLKADDLEALKGNAYKTSPL